MNQSLLGIAACLICAAGCGSAASAGADATGTNGNDAASATGLNATEFVDKAIATACQKHASLYSSPDACKSAESGAFAANMSAVQAGLARFDATAAQDCLDAIAADDSTGVACGAHVFPHVGNAPGGACQATGDCAGGYPACEGMKPGACGTCVDHGMPGDPCNNSTAIMNCLFSTCTAGVCAPPAFVPRTFQVGDACPPGGTFHGCGDGLLCAGGKCAAGLAADAVCPGAATCAVGLGCFADAAGATSGHCKPWSKLGESCETSGRGHWFTSSSSGGGGGGGGGPPAPVFDNRGCAYFDYLCSGPDGAKTCKTAPGKGDPCGGAGECSGVFDLGGFGVTRACIAGKCDDRPLVGADCPSDAYACAIGAQCDSTTQKCVVDPEQAKANPTACK